jgi:hypothetical protein
VRVGARNTTRGCLYDIQVADGMTERPVECRFIEHVVAPTREDPEVLITSIPQVPNREGGRQGVVHIFVSGQATQPPRAEASSRPY